jgi:hypothetical protein
MDSAGQIGAYDGVNGFYTNSGTLTDSQRTALFDGNDSATINTNIFGDGALDVCDVYVTYRRSLDSSLNWYRRFWTNGVRVADVATNEFKPSAAVRSALLTSTAITTTNYTLTNQVKVSFASTDFLATASQTLSVPITANVVGDYPLRTLLLNVSIESLDDSPALTSAVGFSYNSALGDPYLTDSSTNNYAGVWLNNGIAGLSNNVTLVTLTVVVPAAADSLSAYAIHFDHASASPNGSIAFPKQTLTGLITLSSRTNSSYNDGIPDSWRLRWFGTTNNLLSMSNACPTGDGINNWKKYIAGVDPNVANDFPSVNARTPVPTGYTSAIHWPTVNGKKYAVEISSSVFGGTWTTNAIITGTGAEMEYNDNSTGTVKFYRVQILQ